MERNLISEIRLQAGDVVELHIAARAGYQYHWVRVRQEFSIIYEDEDLMVINKPAICRCIRLLIILKILWLMG